MTRLVWDDPKERVFETGVDRAVLYLPNADGVPWNGLTSVSDSPDGGTVKSYYVDGIKYLNVTTGANYKATLTALTYPQDFESRQGNLEMYDGLFATAQPHKEFSLSYRTKIGDGISGEDAGYKIHLIFNAMVSPLQSNYKTIGSSVDPTPFSWDIVAVPSFVPGMKPTAHLVIDSRSMNANTLSSIETLLYGDENVTGRLPSLEDLINLISLEGAITIVDNGDGTWTAYGPNIFFSMIDEKTFQIIEANAEYIDANTYNIASTEEEL